MAAAQILGKARTADATSGGTIGPPSITVVLDSDVPADGVLQLAWAGISHPADGDESTEASTCTDTASAAWTIFTSTKPVIGLTRGTAGAFPTEVSIITGPCGRACVAHDLVAGDTVTLTISGWNPGDVMDLVAMLVYLPCEFTAVSQSLNGWGAGTNYANGSSWPDFGFSASELSWDGISSPAIPDANAFMYATLAAYPPASFTPLAGTLLGEDTTGICSLAVVIASVPGGVDIDPGGTWPSARTVTAGNYQYLVANAASSIFWFFKDGTWRNQNVDPDYSLWIFKDGVWRQHGADTSYATHGRLNENWQT